MPILGVRFRSIGLNYQTFKIFAVLGLEPLFAVVVHFVQCWGVREPLEALQIQVWAFEHWTLWFKLSNAGFRHFRVRVSKYTD